MRTAPILFPNLMPGSFPPRTDRHILSGSVKVDGVAAVRRVAVLERATLRLVAITTSNDDGTWSVSGVNEYDEQSLLVIAFDDTGTYNAEVADFVSQVAGV